MIQVTAQDRKGDYSNMPW